MLSLLKASRKLCLLIYHSRPGFGNVSIHKALHFSGLVPQLDVERGVDCRKEVWLFASKGNHAKNYTMARMWDGAPVS